MSVLVIDCGNTRMKLALYDRQGRKLAARVTDGCRIEQVAEIMERSSGVTGAVYGSVGSFDARFVESLRMLTGGELLIVTGQTPLPVRMDYVTPHTLGVDRLAAAVGAAVAFPDNSMLIIDAGSAITLDHVVRGHFRGGNISPGLDMRFRALHDYTFRLPRITLRHDDNLPPVVGNDTDTAIAAGVFGSWIADIAGAVRRAVAARYDAVILTGGDASVALKAMEENWGDTTCGLLSQIRMIHNPDLVSEGLYHIYRHNENLA